MLARLANRVCQAAGTGSPGPRLLLQAGRGLVAEDPGRPARLAELEQRGGVLGVGDGLEQDTELATAGDGPEAAAHPQLAGQLALANRLLDRDGLPVLAAQDADRVVRLERLPPLDASAAASSAKSFVGDPLDRRGAAAVLSPLVRPQPVASAVRQELVLRPTRRTTDAVSRAGSLPTGSCG